MYLGLKPAHPREGGPRISSSTIQEPIFVPRYTSEVSLLGHLVTITGAGTYTPH